MIIINEILTLFRKELPEMLMSDETIITILSDKKNHFICRRQNDNLIGISVINENTIYLLLVDKLRQGCGVGTSLLEESEEYVKTKGFSKIVLGAGNDYIMPGVPMNRGAHKFFVKHGYSHSWGDEGCFDLSMSLCDFNYTEHRLGDTIDGSLYRFAVLSDIQGIAACCEEDASDFIVHYMNEELYKPDSTDPVIVAEKNGEILSALMIGIESGDNNIGYAGCIITKPRHRNKGIAANILNIGTRHMKDMGLEQVWLSYTYSAIVNTYSKLGYKVCMEYFMGEKEF